jgi:hypothetical protein
MVVLVSAWSWRGAADVFDKDWLTTHAVEETEAAADEAFDDAEF